jgi:hypothetical protein
MNDFSIGTSVNPFPIWTCACSRNLRTNGVSVRLNAYGLQEVKVSGDGNCQVNKFCFFCIFPIFPIFFVFTNYSLGQFRALSDQLFRSPEYHRNVRKEVVRQVMHLVFLHP